MDEAQAPKGEERVDVVLVELGWRTGCDTTACSTTGLGLVPYSRTLTTELARRIRDGSLDDRREEVMVVVRESVRAKLLVSNPSYVG